MKQPTSDIATALDVLADALADRIAARLMAGQRPDWVDQRASKLGRNRHNEAVRARVEAGLPGAAIVGRKHFLSADAHAEELAKLGGKKAETGVAAELRRDLKLVGGGR